MHNAARVLQDRQQSDGVAEVEGGSPRRVFEQRQPGLQQHSADRKDHPDSPTRLDEEESVPVGLHRPQRNRQISDPKQQPRASERARPAMERLAPEHQPAQSRQRRGDEGGHRRPHPRAVQIHHPHVGSERLFGRPERRKYGDEEQCREKPERGRFEYARGAHAPKYTRTTRLVQRPASRPRRSNRKFETNASANSTPPRARASSKSPWRVSSTIAVVSTRVLPSMFPPTSITAPTSEMMPPNAATMAAITPVRASRKTAPITCAGVAPSARTCRRSAGSTPSTAVIVRPMTSGSAMMIWAVTIAAGVNSQFNPPSGPLRESSM